MSARHLADWAEVPHEPDLLFLLSSIGTHQWSSGLGFTGNSCLHWTIVICFPGDDGVDLGFLLRCAGFCITTFAVPDSESFESNSTKPVVWISHPYFCEIWLKRRNYLFRRGRRVSDLHLRTSGLQPRGIFTDLIGFRFCVLAHHFGNSS